MSDEMQNAALKEAGDKWLTIGSESWNQVVRREHKHKHKEQQKGREQQKEKLKGGIDDLFADLTLTAEHVKEMAEAEFLIDNLIIKGHMTVYPAMGGAGKSAIFRYASEVLSDQGMKVLYINVDANASDLKKHFNQSVKHGYKVIAPDACIGKSITDVTDNLKAIVDENQRCDDYVFIFDTLKKFTSVMCKSESPKFYELLRSLTVLGATICLLGHCNKSRDEGGNLVFEGVHDLRNDVDDMIYFEYSIDPENNMQTVTTKPDKTRGDFKPISFNIDKGNGLKVTPCDEAVNIMEPSEQEIMDAIKQSIRAGKDTQTAIIDTVIKELKIGKNKILSRLKKFCEADNAELKKVKTRGVGNIVRYEIV